jgi:aspartate aminotransferase
MDISQQQVVIAPGSKPILFALFDILEGDVLLPRPCWVSYEPQVMHARKRLFWVETDEHDRHTVSRVLFPSHQFHTSHLTDAVGTTLEENYQAAISAGGNPRIMLINSPSNPTGRAYSPSTVSEIVEFCSSKGIVLISDEIYADLCFSPRVPQMSAFTQSKSKACIIMTGGLSKVS